MGNHFMSGSFAARIIFPSIYHAEALLKDGKIKKKTKILLTSTITSMLFVLPVNNVSAKISPSFDCQ